MEQRPLPRCIRTVWSERRRGAIWRFWGFEENMSEPIRITPEVAVPVAELEFRASRASGPGGQGVNTTDSRVELRFDVAGSPSLPPEVRERALRRLGSRVDPSGT